MLHRARSLVIAQRRSLGDAIRAHLAEFGMVGPQGRAGLRQIEVLAAQGRPVAEAVRAIEVTEVSSGTSCSTARSSTPWLRPRS